MAQQILAAKVMINPLRRIRTAPALFDLGKSSVEASVSPNVVDENTTFHSKVFSIPQKSVCA